MRLMKGLAGTFVAGLLLGYVLSALFGTALTERRAPTPFVASVGGVKVPDFPESAEARRYMISLLTSDPESLMALGPGRDLVSQAVEFQQAEEGKGQLVPISLTYMGGGSAGRLGVYIYAIELRTVSGSARFFPLALTVLDGRVVRRE